MKKVLPVLISLFSMALLGSCMVDKSGLPDGASLGYNYQPLTTGSAWTYKNTDTSSVDTVTVTMTAQTQKAANNVYHLASWLENGESQDGYYGINHHVYTMTDLTSGFELAFLDDTKLTGGTWGTSYSDTSGTIKLTGTVVEKDINRTVLQKTYSNVIHTRVTFQLNYNIGQGTGLNLSGYFTTDFYLARNIGIIEIDNHSSVDNNKSELLATRFKWFLLEICFNGHDV